MNTPQLTTDRLGFYNVHTADDYHTAIAANATMIHIHLNCGHHWVLAIAEARTRLFNNYCPICAAKTN